MAAAGVDATETAASFPDWSLFPLDPLLVVMAALEAPDLVRAGAACSSWHAAYATVRRHRIPTAESTPCLFYTRADGDPDTATIYSPASGASFRVRMPDLPLRRWSLHGSSHGWLVAADEASNLRLVNPLTGTQHALPPITALHHTEAAATDDQGNPTMYNVWEYKHDRTPTAYTARELRLAMYFKAVLSCSPSAGRECVVLLLHTPRGELSFARLGDKDWTLIRGEEEDEQWPHYGYRDALYNNKDGLFYVLGCGGNITTLDLKSASSSPVVKRIMKHVTISDNPTKYLVMAPWGGLLQVWRMTAYLPSATKTPVQVEERMHSDVLEWYHDLHTTEIQLYMVDIDNQKLERITSLGDHALFLGLNSTIILSTKDLPMLKADCAYLAHDECEDILMYTYNRTEIGVWNFKSGTLEDIDNVHPWLNWPVPIWITPSLC